MRWDALWLIILLTLAHLGTPSARESHITSIIRKGVGLKERGTSTLEELEGALLQNQSLNSQTPHRHTEHRSNHTQSLGKADPHPHSQIFGNQTVQNQTGHRPTQELSKSEQEKKPSSSQQEPNQTAHSQEAHNQTVHRHLERLEPKGTASGSGPLETVRQESSAAQGTELKADQPIGGSINARLVEEAQRQETNRIEREKLAAEKVEAGRLEAERRQAEGLEAQRLAILEAQGGAVAYEPQQPIQEQVLAVEQPAQIQEEPLPLHEPCKELAGTRPPRSRVLDIVIAHYDPLRIQSMQRFWLWFFSLEVVKAWQPYVFIYTQSQDEAVIQQLQPFIQCGGDIVRLANAGRESHVYLQHINRHYEDLAQHTLFSQDEPNTYLLPKKFERMFVGKTGYLPLSFMGHVDCFESWNNIIPPKVIPQLYGMLTHSLCPPTGYAAGFEGQFIVSKQRILDQPLRLYRHLIDMVAAPSDHWVHEYHQFDTLKDQSNPYMGHALERSWSLAFNCYEVWRQANCYDCEINKDMQACGRDACQCYDV